MVNRFVIKITYLCDTINSVEVFNHANKIVRNPDKT